VSWSASCPNRVDRLYVGMRTLTYITVPVLFDVRQEPVAR